MNPGSVLTDSERRRIKSPGVFRDSAHGDGADSMATGRGTAKALSCTGEGNGVLVTAADRSLFTVGLLNTNGFGLGTGAGQDAEETAETFCGAPTKVS